MKSWLNLIIHWPFGSQLHRQLERRHVNFYMSCLWLVAANLGFVRLALSSGLNVWVFGLIVCVI